MTFANPSKKLHPSLMRTRVLAGAVALAAGGAAWLPATPVHAQAQAQAPIAVARALPDFSDLVDQVGPSVVNIRTVERVAQRGGPGGAPMDEEMQEFFRRFFGPNFPGLPGPGGQGPRRPGPPQEEPRPRGVGSGFILTPDGYVMTNAHVVEDASEVIVTLTDKREFKARIVGSDQRTDVAVVKIDATGLPAVKVGDISRLRVGEWVMAIGSPFGLENTVTAGIVSAKQRDTGSYLPFIQTDVAINPGNSGGPLINMRGEVVGINSQIYSRSGGFMGISFSIPIDEAMRVSEQLRTAGRVQRGRIGVQIDEVSKEVAESIGMDKTQGALVRGVEDDAPGQKAGIQAGDVIVKFNGEPIVRPSDLPRMVGNTKPGTKATVTVFRRGSTRDLTVTVAELEPEKTASAPSPREEEAAPAASAAAQSLGLVVRNLTAEQRRTLKSNGVRVEAASEAAQRAGLRPGDVILSVGNTEVENVKDFDAAVAKVEKGKPVSVLYRRGEWAQYALIRR